MYPPPSRIASLHHNWAWRVDAVVTGGYKLVLHAVPRDAFLERVGCLVVEFVFSQS